MTTDPRVEARSHHRVAADLEGVGEKEKARRAYLRAAQAYVRSLKQVDGDAERRHVRHFAEYCLAKANAIDTATLKQPSGGHISSTIPRESDTEALRGQIRQLQMAPGEQSSATLEGVAGLEEAKRVAEDLNVFLRRPDILQRHPGLQPPKGMLLYGPPGCGKTLFARALAGEMGVTFFNASAAEMKSKWYGESLRLVKGLFDAAREAAPSIIFMDEVDALVTDRSQLSNETDRQLVTQFLTELDGFKARSQREPVFLVVATNVLPETLDAAFLRGGRIDRAILVDVPVAEARRQILENTLKGEPVASHVSLDGLAEAVDGYSGADVAEVAKRAVALAVREEIFSGAPREIDDVLLRRAVDEVRPTVSPDLRAKYLEFARQWESKA